MTPVEQQLIDEMYRFEMSQRLECLRLAERGAVESDNVVKLAEKYFKFLEGDKEINGQ